MKQDRRDFLRKSIAASAGISILPSIIRASSLGLGESVAPNDKISMILIGAGGQGRGNMGQFLKMNDVQVVAVCDVDDSQNAIAKKMVDDTYGNSDCRVYKDYREILESEDADTAILALPDHWHAIPVIRAAASGRHTTRMIAMQVLNVVQSIFCCSKQLAPLAGLVR